VAFPAFVAVAELLGVNWVGGDAFFFDEFFDLGGLISGSLIRCVERKVLTLSLRGMVRVPW